MAYKVTAVIAEKGKWQPNGPSQDSKSKTILGSREMAEISVILKDLKDTREVVSNISPLTSLILSL